MCVILQQLRDTNAWLKSIKGAYIYSRSISAHNLWWYSPYTLSHTVFHSDLCSIRLPLKKFFFSFFLIRFLIINSNVIAMEIELRKSSLSLSLLYSSGSAARRRFLNFCLLLSTKIFSNKILAKNVKKMMAMMMIKK